MESIKFCPICKNFNFSFSNLSTLSFASNFSSAALDSYRKQVQDPARVHAMCSDYRAGASLDRELDTKDKNAGKQILAPIRLLCGAHGFPAKSGNVADVWHGWAQQVEASVCDAGHFVMEENPQAVLNAFESFF